MEDTDRRTREPSARRLEHARREGRWPATPELWGVAVWLVLAGVADVLTPAAGRGLAGFCSELWAQGAFRDGRLPEGAWAALIPGALGLAGLGVLLVAIPVIAGWLQKGVVVHPGSVGLDPGRLGGPAGGILDPGEAAGRGLDGALRGAAVVLALWAVWQATGPRWWTRPVALIEDRTLAAPFGAAALVWGGLAGVDLAIRRRRFFAILKMTPEEARLESRMEEGDPRVRGRIRERVLDAAGRGPRRAVLLRDTHTVLVVAVHEDAGRTPVVVCRLEGEPARRFERAHRDAGRPVVQHPDLTAATAGLRPRQSVPPELYSVLADVHRRIFPAREGPL